MSLGRAYIEIHADGKGFSGEMTAGVDRSLAQIQATATVAFDAVEARMLTAFKAAGAAAHLAAEEVATAQARQTAAADLTAAGLGRASEAALSIGVAAERSAVATQAAMGRSVESILSIVPATARADAGMATIGASATRAAAQTVAATTTAVTAVDRLAGAGGRVASSFAALTGLSGKQLGGAVAAFSGYQALKSAGDLEQQVRRLITTAGELPENFELIRDGALKMSGQVGMSARELVDGMYLIEQSGFHGKDALTAIRAAAQGAVQEQADLDKVVDALTTTLHDFHLEASDSPKVISQMIEAVSHGKISFESMTGAMHSIEPIAAAAGMSFAQTSGALAAMTASGMHADQAAQNLASSIRSFSKPTRPMIDELNQLGLSANELSENLGKRGIAGTLQVVEEAIMKKMGPSGKVLLDSFNQSKEAAEDARIVYSELPPNLQKLADAYRDGTLTGQQWRDALKKMPAEQNTLATTWRNLNDRASGFSQILKSGSPATQTFIGALGKAVGTAEGLNVALQLTGKNGEYANEAIAAIAEAAEQADGNIHGWDEVQKNFNQQMHQGWERVKSMATAIGTDLLPYATKAARWFSGDGADGLEKFVGKARDLISTVAQSSTMAAILEGAAAAFKLLWGTGKVALEVLGPLFGLVEGAAGLFEKLPGPVKAVVAALIALRLAGGLGGIFGGMAGSERRMIGSLGRMGSSVVGFGQNYKLQMRLADESMGPLSRRAGSLAGAFSSTFPRAGAAVGGFAAATRNAMRDVTSAYGQAARAQQVLTAQRFNMNLSDVPRAVGTLSGLRAAAGSVASQGFGAMRAAGGSLVSFLGGPWGVALAGAGIAAGILTSKLNEAKDTQTEWATQLAQGGAATVAANRAMAAQRAELDANEEGFGGFINKITGYAAAQRAMAPDVDEATEAYRKQWLALDPIPQAQAKVAEWSNTLSYRMNDEKASTEDVEAAQRRYQYWVKVLADRQNQLAGATQTTTQAIHAQVEASLSAANADVAASQANTHLKDAIDRYNETLKTAKKGSKELTAASDEVAGQAIQTAQAVAEQARQHSKATTDEGKQRDADRALLKSLQETATQLGVNTPKAISDLIASLAKSTATADLTRGSMKDLGVTVTNMPSSHLITINAPTADQKKRIEDLGLKVRTLPNGQIVVTANTKAAQDAVDWLVKKIKGGWTVTGTGLHVSSSKFFGGGTITNRATGAYVSYNAKGDYKPMRSDVAEMVPANTWRVIGDRPVGDEAFIPIDGARRSHDILATTARRMGYMLAPTTDNMRYLASGGYFQLGPAALPVELNSAKTLQIMQALQTGMGIGQMGGGTVGGGAWGAIWQYVKARVPQARINSTYRAGDPGYHGRNKAIDFGYGAGPGGAGSAGLALIERVLYEGVGRNLAEIIYDGVGNSRPDVKNGRDHTYNAATRRQHANHVHAAVYGDGGLALMRGGYADIVPPGRPRIIGDNLTSDEAYVPLNGSPRSKAIWTNAGIRMGELTPDGQRAGVAAAAGGRPINFTYAPAMSLPPAASAEEVVAITAARLGRDFTLGLGDAMFGAASASTLGAFS